jgi:hypothetical protein
MIRPRRWLPVIAATVLLAGGSAVLTAGPAHAASNIQICSNLAPNLCANADGGFHSPGDSVILYHNGDPNNTFSIVLLTGICNAGGGVGAGYVHNDEGGEVCPFPVGSGLNSRYDKDAIVEFQDYTSARVYDPPLCIADGSGSGSTLLEGCSWIQNNFGFGGARGSVFILSHITNVNNMGTTPFFAVNYYYSTSPECGHDQPAWMIGGSLAVPIYENICKALHEWYQT